jgi:hypothetical protein
MNDVDTTGDTAVAPARSRRISPAVLGLVLVLVLVTAAVAWRALGTGDDTGPTAAPYDDPQAVGSLTLCSADGTPVTGGGVDDRPFATAVVGETGLPDGLDPAGAVVTLFGYQPREGVAAEEFSGVPLTAAHPLADPDRPAVPVTDDVYSVGDFVAGYPASFDGFVQLRLYLGTPEVGTLTDRPYDTADLRVVGDRWELVGGGTASCDAVAP